MLRAIRYVAILGASVLCVGASANAQVPSATPASPPQPPPAASPASASAPISQLGASPRLLEPNRVTAGTASAASPLIGGDGSGGYVVLLVARGTAPNVSPDPSRTMFSVPLYNLATGEQVGISHHNFTNVAPGFAEDLDTYELAGGTIFRDAVVSAAPDAQLPGFFLTSVHAPQEIRSLTGTGVFAGHVLGFRLDGFADLGKLPREMTLNEIYVVTVH